MAITRSQTTGKFRVSNGSSLGAAFGGAVSVGDLLIVGAWGYITSIDTPDWLPGDCTDTENNVYVLASVSPFSVGLSCAVWFAIAKTAATPTVTINPTGAANFWGVGCATSFVSDGAWGVTDQRVRASGNSSTPATGNTGTTEAADELIIAMLATEGVNQASITVESVSPAWTEEAEELSWTNYIPGEMDSRIVSAAGAQSCSWTIASAADWSASVTTFRECVAGGSGGGGAFTFVG